MEIGIASDKKRLRAEFSAVRSALASCECARADAAIAAAVAALREFDEASAVFTYVSVGAEVDTRALIELAWNAGKVVAVPRCVPGTRELAWQRIETFDVLERTALGIDEPPADPAAVLVPDEASIALVPGLSFDAEGFRLGYGGGYYDTFLAQFPGTSIGLCRACQLSQVPLPREPHDLPVDLVITDATIRP